MSTFAVLRFQKIHQLQSVQAVLRHNRRDVKCASVVNPNIKNPKLVFNKMSDDTKLSYTKFFKKRTQNQSVRKDSVKAIEAIMTFSRNSLLESETRDWIETSVSFLGGKFGWDNIYDVSYHIDELDGISDKTDCPKRENHAVGHLHVIIIPIYEGRLNCRAYLGGKQKLISLQDDYASAVAKFGLTRGEPKKLTGASHKELSVWYKEQAQKLAELKSYKEMFGMPDEWDFEKKLKYYDVYNKFLNEAEMFENKINIEEKNI